MPSAFHPRSKQTTSLFGLTLGVAFLVVGMPHILPCPAPRRTFADVDSRGRNQDDREIYIDAEGRRRQRKRKITTEQDTTQHRLSKEDEAERFQKEAHQCPVPKPAGILGRILGFSTADEGTNQAVTAPSNGRGKERQQIIIRTEALSPLPTQSQRNQDRQSQ